MKTSSVSPRLSRTGGFGLAEMLAALLVLSVGLLAVLSAMAAARETQDRTIYISIGRNIAQSKIEQVRAASFASIDAFHGVISDPSLPLGNQVSVAVSRYPDTFENNMRHVRVTVTWPEGGGMREVSYESLVAKR